MGQISRAILNCCAVEVAQNVCLVEPIYITLRWSVCLWALVGDGLLSLFELSLRILGNSVKRPKKSMFNFSLRHACHQAQAEFCR